MAFSTTWPCFSASPLARRNSASSFAVSREPLDSPAGSLASAGPPPIAIHDPNTIATATINRRMDCSSSTFWTLDFRFQVVGL